MVEEVKQRLAGEPITGLTCRDFEKRFGIKAVVVGKLIQQGHISTVREINPTNRCPVMTIPVEEAELFCQTYVTLAEVANEKGYCTKKNCT